MRRLRWEQEQPFWFTEKWKARILKKMLAGVGEAQPQPLTPAAERAGTSQTVVEMLITWGDTVSNLVALEVLLRRESTYAELMIAMLIFANINQALASLVEHRGALVILTSLLGLKPVVYGFFVLLGIEETGGQFDNVASFAMSRAIQTGLESIPQVTLQALALATPGSRSSIGQYISVVWSILSITYTFVSVSVSMDTNPRQRSIQPMW